MNVHVLATCLDKSRLDLAMLVFKTLRVGFPTADLFVDLNGTMPFGCGLDIMDAANAIGAKRVNVIHARSHGEWIEGLIATHHEPFWICDCDVVFFDKVEDWQIDDEAMFAGRYEPEYWEPWTKTLHVARLHPSLMWFNPAPLRAAIRGWPGKHEFFDSVKKQLIQWSWVPEVWTPSALGPEWQERRVKFFDTCAGLWHAELGGTPFSNGQNAAFEHLFCGSYGHLMPGMPGLEATHMEIVADPPKARGLWAKQQEWYAEHIAF